MVFWGFCPLARWVEEERLEMGSRVFEQCPMATASMAIWGWPPPSRLHLELLAPGFPVFAYFPALCNHVSGLKESSYGVRGLARDTQLSPGTVGLYERFVFNPNIWFI